jgi:hypothetical protein
MKSDFFTYPVFGDLIDDASGKIKIHIAWGSFHKRLWTEQAVEIADIGEFNVNPLEGDTDMPEMPLIHAFF